ncbi:hypothetical protein QVD17_38463 [Tagetes erecta]|uniref:Uncharacterized protein n=1 Tax=Tagetes erecta TaxID=13708 RepID=A0AAD8JS71_TARER|nr:hypothetical protein QVD17_38463 [Tagetes erecta]
MAWYTDRGWMSKKNDSHGYLNSEFCDNVDMFLDFAFSNEVVVDTRLNIHGPESFDILQGHSKATMLSIINNAAQGILSSFFFKYDDTILKKYSSMVATIFTGFASAALFGHTLSINFMLGISIVFISMHQATHVVSDERRPLLPT